MLRFERIPLERALVLLLLTIAAPLTARTRAAPARSAVDQEYIAALATANRFLQAWQSQDQETGILLLSDKVKGQTAESTCNRSSHVPTTRKRLTKSAAGENSKQAGTFFPLHSSTPATVRGCSGDLRG
jgi:hypothetical protein